MRSATTAIALLLAALAPGCDRGVQDPTGLGSAEVWVAALEPGDQAMILRFEGRLESFDPAPGVRHFLAQVGGASRLAVVAADPLPGGGVLLGTARWSGGAVSGEVAIEQVARWDFQPRADVAGYTVQLFPR